MLIHFNASQIFQRMLLPFVVGWVCGLVLAMVYGSYYHDSLQYEFGRAVLIGVTSGQAVTALLVRATFRSIEKRGRTG